jgi:U6 snRNA-associated Sm-like protein LSm8
LQGKLAGFDPVSTLVLESCIERIFSLEGGVESVPLGVYIIRGDSVATVGLVDEAADAAINWNTITGTPIQPSRAW